VTLATHVAFPVSNAENIAKNMGILRYFEKIKQGHLEIYNAVLNLINNANDYPKEMILLETKFNGVIYAIKRITTRIKDISDDFLRLLAKNKEEEMNQLLKGMAFDENMVKIEEDLKDVEDTAKQVFLSDKFDIELSKIFGIMQYYDTQCSNKETIDQLIKEKKDRELTRKEASQNKSLYDSLFESSKAKLDEVKIAQENLFQLRQHFTNNKTRLLENIDLNDSKKVELMNELNDSKVLTSISQENQKKRNALQEELIKKIQTIRSKTTDLLETAVKTDILQKKYHLVFILDKSGSMDPHFKNVKQSVQEILQSRKEKSLSDEKISVIKFNDKAEFDTMDASIKDEIVITDDVGGGTSFIAPLKRLDELLEQIESSIYMPVVFFLSDGYGSESKEDIKEYCYNLHSKCYNFDIMFFTVGFGPDADQETLEEMARVFNNGNSVLKVGNELIKLYHHANTKDQLKKAFTLYQKLFDFQKNLAQQQLDVLNSFSRQAEQNHNHEIKMLESMYD
jgi:Mg-chelatase subunit ChlD